MELRQLFESGVIAANEKSKESINSTPLIKKR